MRQTLGLGFTPAGSNAGGSTIIIPPINTMRETSQQDERTTSIGQLRKVS